MSDNINILILSCGSRNKIIQYFKKTLKGIGLVMATDCSKLAPALYEADKHFIVPRIDADNYMNKILKICKENHIKGVFSLIDLELIQLAKYKQAFLDIGTLPIVSDLEAVERSFDKYDMYNFLIQENFKTIKSYIDKEVFYDDVATGVINYPVFVKPVRGSASININKVHSQEEIESLFNRFDNLMIQEYMNGTEYGADVYIDMISEEPIAIFIKEKLAMRAGETDKSISIKDNTLFDLIKKFVRKTNYKGIIDIDIFCVKGEYYISEVNPRFGGGYPHAFESGVNVPKMIINNINGNINEAVIAQYKEGIHMLKYSVVKMI